jgi:hypothetical protein
MIDHYPYDADIDSEELRQGQELGIVLTLLLAALIGMIRSFVFLAIEVLDEAVVLAY